jgi:hypothetical protein
MDGCPYVTLLPLPTDISPSAGGKQGKAAKELCVTAWLTAKDDYASAFKFGKTPKYVRGGKIERNLKACGLPSDTDPRLEVFITKQAEETAAVYISDNYPNGYIFQHTRPGLHKVHDWDASVWIQDNLPSLPVLRTGRGVPRLCEDINVFFVLAREAAHRVLSSSVFVHACDAMDVMIDVVHYGAPNPHGLPLDPTKIGVTHGSSYDT